MQLFRKDIDLKMKEVKNQEVKETTKEEKKKKI